MNLSLLGDNLRLARMNLGYSQEYAAELCGISGKTLGKIERGQTNMTVEVLNKIETGMSVSLQELITNPCDASDAVEYYAILEPLDTNNDAFTYGVMVCKPTAASVRLLTIVHDVSTIPSFVIGLVRDMNTYQLSPVHLLDVLLDSLP